MVKKKEFWITVCLTAFTAISTFFLTYIAINNKMINQNPSNEMTTNEYVIDEEQKEDIAEETTQAVAALNVPRITPSTKLVYEYYYEEDGQIKKEEEVPPYFLIDMTRKDLEESYPDWQLKSFSQSEVVMRKNIVGKSKERYIIKEYDGYVAVFFQEPIDGVSLRELTDTPVASLSPDEQNKLKTGINVIGEEALMSALENYES